MKKLLLISNSTMAGESYLSYTLPYIQDFFKEINFNPVGKKIIFIPYAAITFSYEEYTRKVNNAFSKIKGLKVINIESLNKNTRINKIKNSDLIITGGGNTWHLVYNLNKEGLMDVISDTIKSGTPYIGWSAGSNIACPTLKTTNDMPIVEPESFNTLNLIDFQINPHYTDKNPEGHAGETREERIIEFITFNKEIPVVGLREGTMLYVNNDNITLWGNKPAKIFKFGENAREIQPMNDIKKFI